METTKYIEESIIISEKIMLKKNANILESGTEPFRPYARLLSILGDQLITDKFGAIIELVKNSYDADATEVTIGFNNFDFDSEKEVNNPAESQENFSNLENNDFVKVPNIVISDNGCGMTKKTIIGSWLKPATPNKIQDKQKGKKLTPKGRIIQGEKGIGRFATHKLGSYIEIFSKVETSSSEIYLKMDYEPFTFNTDEVHENNTNDNETIEYKFLDEINNTWHINGIPEKIISHGTWIHIEKLRSSWNSNDLDKLYIAFQKMMPLTSNDRPIKKDFEIKILIDGKAYEPKHQLLTLEQIIPHNTYSINGSINEQGMLTFSYHSTTTNRHITNETVDLFYTEKYDIKKLKLFKENFVDIKKMYSDIGPIEFELYAYNLSGKNISFTKDEKDFIKDHNVYVYRDNIRVYPYGEKGVDWLELDKMRSVERAGNYFSYNDLIGFVFLSQETNPTLQDATNREGIINTHNQLNEFKALLLAVVYIFKQESNIDKLKEQISDSNYKTTSKIYDEKFNELKREINKSENKVLLEKANAFFEASKNHYNFLREKVTITEDLAGLGMAVEKSSHDTFSVLNNVLLNADKLLNNIDNNLFAVDDCKKSLQNIYEQTEFIKQELQILQPLFRVARKKISTVSVHEQTQKIFKYYNREIDKLGISVEILIDKDIIIETYPGFVLQILINFMQNSIYWLEDTNNKQILVKIDGISNEFIFADNGPGIREDVSELVFEEFFSLKAEGRGLGLYIVKEILERMGAEIELIFAPEKKLLSGANFLIKFNKG